MKGLGFLSALPKVLKYAVLLTIVADTLHFLVEKLKEHKFIGDETPSTE